jgi:hypothetical protein
MSFNTPYSAAGDDDDELMRRYAAAAGRLPPSNVVELPQVDVTAEETRPPTRMSLDEFPDPEPGPTYAPQQADSERAPIADPIARYGQALQLRAPELEQPDTPEHRPIPEEKSSGGGNRTPVMALIADAFLNRGRGVGSILALGAAQNGPNAELEREYKRAQIEELQRRHGPEDQAYKDAMMQYRWDALHQRGDSAQGVQGRYDTTRNDRNNPTSQRNTTQVSQAGAVADARKRAQLDAEHALVEQTAGDAASVAAGRTAGQLDTEHNFAPTTQADAAARAKAVADATLPSKLAEKAAPGAAPPTVSPNDLVPIPGSVIEVPEMYGSVMGNAPRAEKLTAAVGSAQTLDAAVSHMRQVAASGSRLLPGEQKSSYDAAYGEAIGALTELYHSGVLNESEWKRYKEQLPTLTPGTSDLMDALGSVSGRKTNTRADMLKGFQDSVRELNTVKMRTIGGIRPTWADEQAPPSTAIGSPKRAGYQRDGLPAESLAITGTGQGPRGLRGSIAATPEIPREPPLPEGAREQASDLISEDDPPMIADNGDGTYDVYEPGQRARNNVRLTPQQLQAARAGGWTIR